MSENKNPKAEEIIEKIKAYVAKGNVARILLKHGDNTILNIPLNVGIIGTILGVSVAPWALIASAVATLGFDCKIELEKTDGEIVEIFSREVGNTAVNVGKNLWNDLKDKADKGSSDPLAPENVVDAPEETEPASDGSEQL